MALVSSPQGTGKGIFQRKWNPDKLKASWLLMAVWTGLVAASLLWNIHEARRNALELAYAEAQLSYTKDLSYRLWAAGHGGVYVPVTPQTPPNPVLSHIKDRDIKTPSGQTLTLVNPAYMTRQVHELASRLYGARGHLTSLKPLRPENAPDPWEKKALEAFSRDADEVKEVVNVGGQPHLRFMRPFRTEKACLKCHASQGNKEGDIQGGISLDIPLERYFAGVKSQALPLGAGHFLIWMLGLTGIVLRERHLRRNQEEQQRAVAVVQESREDLNRAQAVAHTGSWRLNVQRNELTGSDESHRIFGIPAGTPMTYESFLEAVHPEDREYVDRKWKSALEGEPYDIEHRILVDGRVKWVRERAELEYDAQGRLLGGFGTVQDITRRKLLQEELKAAHAKLQATLERITDGFLSFDREWRFTFLNDTGAALIGGKKEEFIGRVVWELYPEAVNRKFYSEYHRAMETGIPVYFQEFYPEPLNAWFECHAYPSADGLSVFYQDITKRMRQEELLRLSEETSRRRAEELEKLMELAPVAIWIAQDPECRSIIGNRAAYQMYEAEPGHNVSAGTTEGEIINTERRFFAGERELKPQELPMQVSAAQGQDVLDFEMDALLPSSRRMTMLGNSSPLFDDKGRVRGAIGVFLDITARKRAEEALRQAHDDLERQVHERTADLSQTVEQLEREITERQRVEETLRESQDRLRQLASQLLTAQEMERKRLAAELHDELGHALLGLKLNLGSIEKKLAPEQEDVKEEIRGQLDYIKEVIQGVRRLYHDLSPGDVEDLGLTKALGNLISDFAGHVAGITWQVDLEKLDGLFSLPVQTIIYRIIQEALTNIGKHANPTAVTVSGKRENHRVHFVVQDNGTGFDVDRALGSRSSMAGMGLAAMEERLNMVGGTFEIDSREREGTRLSFIIPTLSEKENL
jgi:PAS domain S-box-containing protein